jgi:hypothetical protein
MVSANQIFPQAWRAAGKCIKNVPKKDHLSKRIAPSPTKEGPFLS